MSDVGALPVTDLLDTITERGTRSHSLSGEVIDFERFYLIRPDELPLLLAESAWELGKAAGEKIVSLEMRLQATEDVTSGFLRGQEKIASLEADVERMASIMLDIAHGRYGSTDTPEYLCWHNLPDSYTQGPWPEDVSR